MSETCWFGANTNLNLDLNLLPSALVRECRYQLITSINYTDTIDHRGLEAQTA